MAIENHFLSKIILKKFPEAVPHAANSIVTNIFLCDITRLPKSDNEKDILGSGPPARFVTCPVDKRFDRCSFTNIEGSHALWCVEFMTG